MGGWVINGWDVASALGGLYISAGSNGYRLFGVRAPDREGRSTHSTAVLGRYPSGKERLEGPFAECVALAASRGVEGPWSALKGKFGQGYWFPAAAVAKAKETKLHWHDSDTPDRPVKFSDPGVGCTVKTDGQNHSGVCGRLAVEQGENRGSYGDVGEEVWRCSMHASSHRRSTAHWEAWHESWDAARAEDKRKDENRVRCAEVLEKIRPLLAELGVHPDTLAVGSAGPKVGILLPAETAELLTAKAIELEELMGDLGERNLG